MNVKPRWKKIGVDLWGNKTRTLLVVLSIAIGVFAVGMVANAYLLLDEATNSGYRVTNPSSAFLLVTPFKPELVDTIRDMPEVLEAEGRIVLDVRLKLGGHWYTASLSALEYEESRINLIDPVQGAPIPGERQLLIDRTALALTDFTMGEQVIVEMGDGRRYEMPIAGAVRDQNANPSINSGHINIYTTIDTIEWLGESSDFNQFLYVAVENKDDPVYIKALTGRVKDKIERSGHLVLSSLVFAEPGVSPVKFIIETIRSVLGILALVSLALSAILVFNTMSALIMRQVKFIGIMKSVGAKTRDLVRMYLMLVTAYGLLAFLLAVPAAIWAAFKFAQFIASPALLDLSLPPLFVSPFVLLLELSVSLLVPILAAIPAIMRGTRVTVHAALNFQGLSEEDFSGTMLERVIERIRFMTGPWLLSLGNILRDRRRAALTLGTLILGGAVFIGVLSVSASSNQTVAEMGQEYRFDIQVDFERPYRLPVIERHALAIPGVERVEGWASANGAIVNEQDEEGNNMTILAPPAGSVLTHPKIIDGRWLQPGDENALVIDTSLLREDPNLAVGDEIVLKIAGQEEPWTIIGVYQSLGVKVWYESYANYEYVSRLTGAIDQTSHVQLVTTYHDALFQEQMASTVETAFREHGLRVSSIETSSALRGIQEDQFDIVVNVLMIMALLITLVGGLGLAGTMSINVLERTREIGVMRALGATDGTVVWVVLMEGVLMALLSWLASILLAVPVGKLLSRQVGSDFANGPLTFVYSIPGALFWLALVVVIAIVASYIPARNASRLTVRDVLAYE
ncbi:MAG: ABC transporter permease [Anaerolineaceae bacterium]|nr:MAG: ABC transporter permease [Anaerolineaceae bacterium]